MSTLGNAGYCNDWQKVPEFLARSEGRIQNRQISTAYYVPRVISPRRDWEGGTRSKDATAA